MGWGAQRDRKTETEREKTYVCLCVVCDVHIHYTLLRVLRLTRNNLGSCILQAEFSCPLKDNSDGYSGSRTGGIFD